MRLKATEQNLERIDDVVTQLGNQLENLKRQARQASRYRNLSGEIRKFEATGYHLRWKAANSALTEAESTFTQFTSAVADATALQAKTTRDQAVSANALPALRDQAAIAGATLQRLQLEQGALEKEEAQTKVRIEELLKYIQQFNDDIEREKSLLGENKTVFDRLFEEEAQLKAENASSGERRRQAEITLRQVREKQEQSEQAFNTTAREIAELNARRSGLENTVRQAEAQIIRLDGDLSKITNEIASLDEKLAQDLFVNAHRKTLEEVRDAVFRGEKSVHGLEQATQAARDVENTARSIATALQREFDALTTEARTLERVLNVGRDDEYPKLIDELSTEAGYEGALGAALGDDLDASIHSKAAAYWAGASAHGDDPALPAGVEPLANFVAAPGLIARRLYQIGVIDHADANRLVMLLKPGQRLVTRDGDLWRWDGFVASAEAETPAAQRLAQKNRLIDLEEASSSKRLQVDVQGTKLAEASALLQQAINAERRARETLKGTRGNEAKARDALARIESEASRLAERRTALSERQTRLETDLENTRTHCENQKTTFSDVPSSDVLNQRLQAEQALLATDRAAVAEARAIFETLARETEICTRRLQAIDSERKSWLHRKQAAEKQIAILSERYDRSRQEFQALQDAPGTFARRRAALFKQIEDAEGTRSTTQEALLVAEQTVQQADHAAKQALAALSEIRESRARTEERVESAKMRKQDLAREIAEKLECSPAGLLNLMQIKEGTPLPDATNVEKRLERLKTERERLGGVNLRAEHEMEEISKKQEELISERDDLIEAIHQLRVAINNLNREGRQRLLAAFDEVNEHFKRLFTHLFGGGTAELQLTESEDPLEAGLDIIARPPGKKPQTMTLLSGGEQALTAMALIFAVFLTNPAPICVLDEVDAPLDDANVERFCNLLDNMVSTTETRFLTITHNPITMARMSRLFGVTMAERGVSQLVSVDLETAESFREAG